jgi:hypothetical protein
MNNPTYWHLFTFYKSEDEQHAGTSSLLYKSEDEQHTGTSPLLLKSEDEQ